MSPIAVIQTGGKQYHVELGQTLDIDKLSTEGKQVTFSEVLLVVDGDKVELGQPTLTGTTVVAEIVEPELKGDKLRVFRYKAKSRYRKTTGHRQSLTSVKIVAIGAHKLASDKKPAKPAPKPAPKTTKKPAKPAPAKKSAPKKSPKPTAKKPAK